MKIKIQRTWFIFILSCSALASPLFTLELQQQERPAKQVHIGIVGPFEKRTGASYQPGLIKKRAITYVQEHLRNYFGLPDTDINITFSFESDDSNPTKARKAATKLIDYGGVALLIGSINSSCTIALGEIAASRKTPVISPISTSTKITSWQNGDPWIFRVSTPDSIQMERLVTELKNLKERNFIKHVVLLYEGANEFFSGEVTDEVNDEDTYGGGLKEDFIKAWTKIDETVPITIQYSRNLRLQDVDNLLSEIKKEYKNRRWPKIDAIGLFGLHFDALTISQYINSNLNRIKKDLNVDQRQWLYLFGGSGIDIAAFTDNEKAAYVLVQSGDIKNHKRDAIARDFKEWQESKIEFANNIIEFDHYVAKTVDAIAIALQATKTLYQKDPELFKPENLSELRLKMREQLRSKDFTPGITLITGFDRETGEAKRITESALTLSYVDPVKKKLESMDTFPETDPRVKQSIILWVIFVVISILSLSLFFLNTYYKRKLGNCFISTTEQSEACRKSPLDLRIALEVRHITRILGFRTFFYRLDMITGEDIDKYISNHLKRTNLFVAIITREYANSRYCQRELDYALVKGLSIIPVLIGRDSFSVAKELKIDKIQCLSLLGMDADQRANEVEESLRGVLENRGIRTTVFLFRLWRFLFRTSLYEKVRLFIKLFPAELTHRIGLVLLNLPLQVEVHNEFKERISPCQFEYQGVRFRNRVGIAAGFDKNANCLAGTQRLGVGFVEVGTILVEPWSGHQIYPRITRLERNEAIWNRLGFPSDGLNRICKRIASFSQENRHRLVIACNIGPHPGILHYAKTPKQYLNIASGQLMYLAEALYEHADFFVVNLSSPNTPGLRDLLQSEDLVSEVLSPLNQCLQEMHVKYMRAARVLLLTKIAPEDSKGYEWSKESLRKIIEPLIVEKVCDGFVATNTSSRLVKDYEALLSGNGLEVISGGISGTPIRKSALNTVRLLREIVGKEMLIIGCGGILEPFHALEFIDAGADLVEIYTGLVYRGPSLARECAMATLGPRRNL